MIQSFGNRLTEKIFNGIRDKEVSKFPQDVLNIAKRKLDMIEFATVLQDLAIPPGNRLEKLKGDLEGYYSIRINDQWRIVFIWQDDGAHGVLIIDYH
ncbi:MAG TPA: type II toxin-antitoxin system RelE/ParE family toxin [Candidatus Obscuribacterales bacterium]